MANTHIIVLLTLVLLISRTGILILSPLVLDADKLICNQTCVNLTQTAPSNPIPKTSATYMVICEAMVMLLISVLVTALQYCHHPQMISYQWTNLPISESLLNGVSTAISTMLYHLAISGQRIPPYLSGILANFSIPLQFAARYIILKKPTTMLKLICAFGILMSEFLCLIPVIFPSLETAQERKDNGGATGFARILWPMIYVVGIIPFVISNVILERNLNINHPLVAEPQVLYTYDTLPSDDVVIAETHPKNNYSVAMFIFTSCLFRIPTLLLIMWLDLIPGFGTCNGFTDFKDTFIADIACLFGYRDCGLVFVGLSWAMFINTTLCSFALFALIKYSEGAAYAIIILAFRMPLNFLFWSVFDEIPFRWHPHDHLSTWLSIVAVLTILICVIFYEKGDAILAKRASRRQNIEVESEAQ